MRLQRRDLDAPAWGAVSVIEQRLDDLLDRAQRDQRTTRAKTSARVQRLKSLRDQILSLTVIWVPLDAEDDAYEIFETLNARGKDLELSDRLKNFFLSHLRAQNANVDDYRDRWNAIRSKFSGEPSHRDINRFILHWWLSKSDYVAERKAFRAIKLAVHRRQTPDVFVEFEEDANLYRAAVDTSSRRWTLEQQPLRDSLDGLRVMRIAQPMPFVLSLLRAWSRRQLKIAHVRKALQAIESFHFKANAIATKSSSGGISEMYASHARQLYRAATPRDRRECIGDLMQKLKDRSPPFEEFREGFRERLYLTNQVSRDKDLVRYVLARMDTAHAQAQDVSPADHTKYTIEHIAPQTRITDPADPGRIGSIGNLLFVTTDLNSDMDSKPFADKKAALRRHRSTYDIGDILRTKTWGKKQIETRTDRLAKIAYDDVWT